MAQRWQLFGAWGSFGSRRRAKGETALRGALLNGHPEAALPLALAFARQSNHPTLVALRKPSSRRPPPANPRLHYAACWAGDHDRDACEAAARARDAEAFKGGMTVKEINAAFGEHAGELKNPTKRLALIDMGLIDLFML